MKLFKVSEMFGVHTRSAFDPTGFRDVPEGFTEMPEYAQLYDMWRFHGFTDAQTAYWIQTFYLHNINVMGLPPSRAWRVTQSAVESMNTVPPPAILSPAVIYFAVVLAVIAIFALIFNPTFTQEYKFRAPATMYLMTYRERIWLAELLEVSDEGVGTYERGIDLGEVLLAHEQNHPFTFGRVDRLFFLGTHTPMARKLLIFHVFQWWWWDAKYIGLMEHIGGSAYKIRGGVKDPELPVGPYVRPGGPIFFPGYEGIYIDYPFLPNMHEVAI